MRITAIEVYLLDLPLREPFVASHGETTTRTIAVVRMDSDIGSGWGECSALPSPTYTAEYSTGAYDRLSTSLAPLLVGQTLEAADVLSVLGELSGDQSVAEPMTVAALEMAALDIDLRDCDASLATHLGSTLPAVPAGVSIGLDAVSATVHKAESLAAEGYRRFKFKIQPGHDTALLKPLRDSLPTVELHVDANGAYPADTLDEVERLADLGVDAFEQPFSPKDHATTARLIERLEGRSIAVVADEAVASIADAKTLLDGKAMSGLSIKPSRVGGMAVARSLHDLCVSSGIPATAGGMLETGLGRHALVALAGLPGFSLTGDLSPAGRWLADDPWQDLTMADGKITVPAGPGVAPQPDLEVLDRYTIARTRVKNSARRQQP